ncbi:hypothetical protein [Actinopolyspora halophila]|uniref:hypothetical protein n=1 Tax=Actinopolyspora halophila TaxID=1850 RepID=UPI00036EA229|nr:hypothetical protein [Actinopolyspora halophila]
MSEIPTKLKAARITQGWTAAHVVRELRRLDRERGNHPYGVETVKRSLRLWENGDRAPAGWAMPLLEQLFGRTAGELGITEPEREQRLREQARAVLSETPVSVPEQAGPVRYTATGTALRLLRTDRPAAVEGVA